MQKITLRIDAFSGRLIATHGNRELDVFKESEPIADFEEAMTGPPADIITSYPALDDSTEM